MMLAGFLFAQLVAVPAGLDSFLPVPESNPLTPEKIRLGRQLFFDKRLSKNNTVACAKVIGEPRWFDFPWFDPLRADPESASVFAGPRAHRPPDR